MSSFIFLASWALQIQSVAPNSFGNDSVTASDLQSASPQLSIVENQGQFRDSAKFVLSARDRTVRFAEDVVEITLSDGERFQLNFGAEGQPLHWQGLQASGTSFNYCKGDADNWVLGAPGWSSISAAIRPGVDLVFEFADQRLKYSFQLAAGILPDDLQVRFSGAENLVLQEDGGLIIQKGSSQIRDEAPLAWQVGLAGRHEVDVQFQLADGSPTAKLVVGDYDPTLPLTVDPEMLLFCGFIGGALDEQIRGLDVDDNGNIFVAGFAESPDMPVVNAFQDTFGGGEMDVWIGKITPQGNFAFLTYLGGSSKDLPYDLSLDPAGNVYVVGGTTSSDFPYLNGPDSVNHGSLDCFVAKLDNDGGPIYSGTFGGTEFDSLRGNYVDADGIHYVIGRSFTVDGSFPINGGPMTSHSGGTSDAIMAKISQDGSTLLFSGFVGGEFIDYGRDVIADKDGNVYACGWTNSDESTFPTAVGPDLTHNGGAKDYGLGWAQYGDAWVIKLTPDGTVFQYAGFIGGARADAAFGLALDEQNRLIVAGHTTSDEATFPLAVGPDLVFKGNGHNDLNPYGDAWVARVKADGTGLDFCGYAGGYGPDRAWRMNRSAVDGAIYLVGVTASETHELPHLNAGARSHRAHLNDAFIMRIERDGKWIDYTSLFAGEELEVIRDVAVGPDNKVHIAGWSESPSDFPIVTPGWTHSGGSDAFVATLPAFHHLIRAGNIWPDPETSIRQTLLKINGSAGSNYLHEVTAMAGVPLNIQVESPHGDNEFFAIYLIPHEAGPEDAYHIENAGVQYGTSTFPLPWIFKDDPQFVTLVNGSGLWYLGTPIIPDAFQAPANFSWTPPSSGTYTLQGVISDSLKTNGFSLTNAVVLRVQ